MDKTVNFDSLSESAKSDIAQELLGFMVFLDIVVKSDKDEPLYTLSGNISYCSDRISEIVRKDINDNSKH